MLNIKSLLNIFQNRITRKRIIISILIFFSFTTIIAFDKLLVKEYKDDSKMTYLNDGWDVLYNGTVYKNNISLDELRFKNLKKGDRIELKNTLMDSWDYKQASMCLSPMQTAIEIFIEDKQVYTYGHDRISVGKCVGNGILFVNLLDEYKGKEIKIIFSVAENRAFSKIDNIWISDWQDSHRYVATENRLAMFLGFFCIIFGVIVIVISIFAMIFAYEYVNILFLAIFSVSLGVWTLCYYNCITIFSIPLYSKALMEYFTLMFTPLPLIIYIKNYVKSTNNRVNTILYRIIIIAHIILITSVSVLHTLKIMLVTAFIPIIYSLLSYEVLYLLRVLITGMKSKMVKKYIFAGLLLIIFAMGYDSVVYIANRYLGADLLLFPGISTLGIIIFINILILDLYNDIVEKKMEKQEKELLIKRAYTDDMTQMNNRRFCTEYMAKILDENIDYSIISFDLNGLKETNDLKGHSKGDLLIKKAASVISDAFGNDGVVGRMGGDEFIAIFKTADTDHIKKLIDEFYTIIDNTNKNSDDLPLSIALGYALSTEEEEKHNNFETIYNLADNRMYENKKMIKGLK